MRDHFSITDLCEALGVCRAAYYGAAKGASGRRAEENARLLKEIESTHAHRHTRCYGSPRMTRELQNRGLRCSENRVARLMRRHGLRARPRKPFRPRTTRPDHAAHPSPNLLAKAGVPTAPGTQIVSDITYIPTREGWLYLAVVIDLFSRAIVGWSVSESLHTDLVLAALRQAFTTGMVASNAIFHSDRGCQYSATATRQLLLRQGLRQSMSATGYCYDNAFAESAFASLKSEMLDDSQPFESKALARTALFDYLQTFYNRKRLHSALDYQSPHAFLNRHSQIQSSPLT
jgi:putative transposase